MTRLRCPLLLPVVLPLACAHAPIHAAIQDGPGEPLDRAACDAWHALRWPRLSRTGAWVGWQLVPADGHDGLLEVASLESATKHALERGEVTTVERVK